MNYLIEPVYIEYLPVVSNHLAAATFVLAQGLAELIEGSIEEALPVENQQNGPSDSS